MTITAAGLAAGNNANNTTNVSHSVGSVTAGQLVVVCGMKFDPTSANVFEAGDCTQSAGTATIDTPTLDRADGGDDGAGGGALSGIWSAIVTGSGTLTVNVAGATAGSYLLIGVEVFNGSWSASRVEDSSGQLLTANGTSSSTTTDSTSAGAALFVSCLQLNTLSATSITPDAAYTTIYENETETDDSGSAIYRIVGSGTTDAGDWTHGTTHNGASCSLVVYRDAAGPAPRIVVPAQSIVMR